MVWLPNLKQIWNNSVREVKNTLSWAEKENAKMSDFSWYYKSMYGDMINSFFHPNIYDFIPIGGTKGSGKNGGKLVPVKPSIAESRQELSKIAAKYGLLKCFDAAKTMKDYLLKNGLKGQQIIIEYKGGKGFIVSDSYKNGSQYISDNGKHTGILYEGKVYDNIHPNGMPEQQWLDDFHGVGPRELNRQNIN